MILIDTAPETAGFAADHPETWRKVRKTLSSVLETAREIDQLQSGLVWCSVRSDTRMRLLVDGHTVTYSLDLARGRARVLQIEKHDERAQAIKWSVG